MNRDKNPINLEDGELTLAQNAIHDPTGSMGGIRKRPGLTKINSSAVTGSVFGITNVPIAPITTRTFYVGADQSVQTTYQWIVSSNAFGATSTSTTPAAVANPANELFNANTWANLLSSKGLQTETMFIYPGAFTLGGSRPIRAYDGTVDRELFKVPTLNVSGVTATAAQVAAGLSAIRQILQADVLRPDASGNPVVQHMLYLVVHDFHNTGATFDNISFVLEYNMDTGAAQQIGQGAYGYSAEGIGDGGVGFTCVAYHQGYLYAGVGSMDGLNSTDDGIYRIRPGLDTTWTLDYAMTSANEVPLSMATYKGLLYVGCTDYDAGAAELLVRNAAGSWSASTTIGGATTNNMWTALKVFGDNLYACSRENAGASSVGRIHKFDNTTWSVVKTIETTADPKAGVEMLVHDGVLYVLCKAFDKDGQVSYSSDGTSWTDQTSGLTGLDVTCVFAVLTD